MARRRRRLILWLLAGVAALVPGALAALWWLIDPDDYRTAIAAQASEVLGRPVTLTGRLRWQLGRQIYIVSEGGELANAAGFGPGPLATWARIRFAVAARPLLDRQVSIDRIHIDGLELQLQRNARGEVNWLLPLKNAAPARAAPELRIGALTLRNAGVRYSDAARGMNVRLAAMALDMNLPADLAADALELSGIRFAGQIADGEFSGTATVRTGATPDLAAQCRLAVPSLRALLAMLGVSPPVMRDTTTLGRMELAADLRVVNGGVVFEALTLKIDDTRLSGTLSLPRLAPLSVRFDLAADQVDLDRYREPAAQASPLVLPLADLKAFDAKGVLRIQSAQVAGAAAREVRLDVE